jgi:ABC-type multidrug transport system fused ATPase/permease subunit
MEFQKTKAAANSVAESQISNVRTVKAFAEEKGSLAAFSAKNDIVYECAVRKAAVWGWFMFYIKFFSTASLAGLILFVSTQVKNEAMSIGDVMAYMLYMQIASRNIGEIANAAQGIAKV